MIEFETDIIEVKKRTHDVKSFRFGVKDDVAFTAGQFLSVTVKVGESEMTKYFSFSNSPTEKEYVEFTKRITESPFSKTLDILKIGDKARLKMPLGTFTLKDEQEKIAFLSGGIGITPIRSMCKYATDKKLPSDIVLIYGNRTEEDIVFRSDFDEMRKLNKNLRVIYTLTSTDINKEKYTGRVGYIDDIMIKKEMPDYEERIFYICGPPKMVEYLVDLLKNKLSIEKDHIRFENFTGY